MDNNSIDNSSSLFTADQIFLRSALLNSLIYVSLFYRFDLQDSSLLHLVEAWSKTKKNALTKEVSQSLVPPKEALFKYLQFCTNYEVLDDDAQTIPPPLNIYDPLIGIFIHFFLIIYILIVTASYIYSRLQTVCRIPKYTENVLKDTIALFSAYQPNVKNILEFLKIVLPQLHISAENHQTLQALMKVIQPYFIQPVPIGTLAGYF